MNIKRRTQENCTCKAYHFTHRAGGGACLANEPGPFCGDCGQPTTAVRRDFGYGLLEAWGSRIVHSDVHTVSKCCEADVFEDASLTKPYEYEPDDY